jgi:hypothetical protein
VTQQGSKSVGGIVDIHTVPMMGTVKIFSPVSSLGELNLNVPVCKTFDLRASFIMIARVKFISIELTSGISWVLQLLPFILYPVHSEHNMPEMKERRNKPGILASVYCTVTSSATRMCLENLLSLPHTQSLSAPSVVLKVLICGLCNPLDMTLM